MQASDFEVEKLKGEASIIRQARNAIKNLTKQERIKKASIHLQDALAYKSPRPNVEMLEKELLFKICNRWHSSLFWEYVRIIFSYIFMYLIVFDCGQITFRIAMETVCLVIFICDTCIEAYVRSFDTFKLNNKYPKLFWGKIVTFILLCIDLILLSTINCGGSRPIRPFRILRVAVPVFYDVEMRKAVQSFFSAYLDIVAFIFFEILLIFFFSLVASNALQIDPLLSTDPDYRNQYKSLSSMFIIMYVVSTYDSYPDNQLIVINKYQPNYILFVVFIFMNMFIFSSIPGSLIYSKFKQTRSKILILDQIKQQTSLILAFVSLVGDSTNLKVEELIEFLWYVYKGKVRFVEYIARICLSLDDNNHKYIQVNEFMQIAKIMLQKPVMLPPLYKDSDSWIKFRQFLNNQLKFKTIVNHIAFQSIITLILLTAFANSIALLYAQNFTSIVLDDIFIFIFVFQLIVRIIAIGPQNFFINTWNRVDSFLIMAGLIIFCIPIQSYADTFLRMVRIFRIVSLIVLLNKTSAFKSCNFLLFTKIYKLYSTVLIILPITIKFIPILLYTFYVFGILGMQFFYDTYKLPPSTLYSVYDKFSHFRDFIGSQLTMVQIMTEAGWSMIAYDLAQRDYNYFGLVMTYFIFMHLMIVDVEAAVVKGIYWEVFFTVKNKQETDKMQQKLQLQAQEALAKKKLQYEEIQQAIDEQTFFSPNTFSRRQFYQNKLDMVIFSTLKNIINNVGQKKSMKASLLAHMIKDNQINDKKLLHGRQFKIHKIHHSNSNEQNPIIKTESDVAFNPKNESVQHIIISQQPQANKRNKLKRKNTLNQIEQLSQVDVDMAMQLLLSQFVINPSVKYSQSIAYPKMFTQYLQNNLKIINEEQTEEQFNLNKNVLGSQESLNFNTFVLHSLLSIQTSKRQQKLMIFDSLVKKGLMSRHTANQLLKKKLIDVSNNADSKGIIRSMLIQNEDEDLIKKFEVEYFSHLYGVSFKEINKVSVQSLIRRQARFTYVFRNLCRYPRIQTTEFFQILCALQSRMSNKLLKRGSLFKFVYKLDNESDIWFSIGYKKQQQVQIRFIKSGIWVFKKNMKENTTYCGKDIFNWNYALEEKQSAQAYIKRFYQSFESLAFTLTEEEPFFDSNPKYHAYDLYTRFINVKVKENGLCINKIMLVILSKEEKRKDLGKKNLHYSLSDIESKQQNAEEVIFSFDDTKMETLQKLKDIANTDKEQLIVEGEGLPFTYINDLLIDTFDVLEKYSQNFANQINLALQQQFDLLVKPEQMASKKELFKRTQVLKPQQIHQQPSKSSVE